MSWGIKKSIFSFLTVLIVHLLFSTKVFAAVVQLFTYACHVGSFVKLFYIYSMALLVEELRYLTKKKVLLQDISLHCA